MTTSSRGSRRAAAAASFLTVITVVAVVALVLGVGVPQAWWSHTGQAFAADTAHHGPCAWIVGPAKAYCERGATTTAAGGGHQHMAAAAWRLGSAGAGVGALVVWRLRHCARRRRR